MTQRVNGGDLPFHYYLHPDAEGKNKIRNPGVVSSKDFLIWIGSNFKQKLHDTNLASIEFENKGFKIVKKEVENNFRSFQMILASYYFYFKQDTKKGIFWAQKAAESGETGSMVILGDAYVESFEVRGQILKSCQSQDSALFLQYFTTIDNSIRQ